MGPACAGLFLGWQAAFALVAAMTLLHLPLRLAARRLPAPLTRIPATACLGVLTLGWLVAWGWINNRAKSVRFLGRRINGVPFLLADLAARNVTGEERLVSRDVLGLDYSAVQPEVTETVARERNYRRG